MADGWLGFEQGWAAMPEGSVALIPPGLVHGQGHTRASHLAVHFDLQAQVELGADAMQDYHNVKLTQQGPQRRALLQFCDGTHQRMVPLIQQPRDSAWWQQRMQSLVATWIPGRHHLPGERLRCASILAELVHAFGYGEAAVIDQRSLSDRVAQVLAEADICDRELRIADLAAAAGLGQTAFRAEVKNHRTKPAKLAGTTPM